MANVTVSTTLTIQDGARVTVRSGNDFVYVFVNNVGTIRAFKGNIAGEPASFAEQDNGGTNQPIDTDINSIAVAIKSNGIVGVIFYDLDTAIHGATPALQYAEFSTESASANQDTWSLAREDVASIDNAGDNFGFGKTLAIAFDGGDDPHTAWNDETNDMGSPIPNTYYANKIGGSWNTRVSVKTLSTSGLTVNKHHIMIAQPTNSIGADRPIISMLEQLGANDELSCYHGTALNATAFTSADDITGATNPNGNAGEDASMAIDSDNKITIAFVNSVGDLMIVEHLATQATWTTWETPANVDTARNYLHPSLAIDGTNRYIFVESTGDNDIRLWKDVGAGFVEETTDADLPNAGTFSYVNVKWASKNLKSPRELDYVFESGTNVLYNTFQGKAPPAVARVFPLIVNSSCMI